MTSAAKWPSGPGETTRSRPVRERDQQTRREERREKKSCAPAVGQVGDTWAGHPWGPAWVTRAQSSSKLTDRTWETFGLKPRTQTQPSKVGAIKMEQASPPPLPPDPHPPERSEKRHRFFQTHSFKEYPKAAQRKEFFKKKTTTSEHVPNGQHCWHFHRRGGTAGQASPEVTKADTDSHWHSYCTRQAKLAEKKRLKQIRHRHNKATREKLKRIADRREYVNSKGQTIFYIPNKREKLRERRAWHRREYRRYMRQSVSELSKKEGRRLLQGNRDKTRAKLFANSSFANKMWASRARHKLEFRIRWTKEKQKILGTANQHHIATSKKGDTLVCKRCNSTHPCTNDFGETCIQGTCKAAKVIAGHTKARGHNTRRPKMHEDLRAITANIRGINSGGKRQTLSKKWEKEGIDIALLTEVQKNTGGMEKEGQWGKYTVFFSTNINPKKKEEMDNRREAKAAETKRKSRKKKGKPDPKPIAKPCPKQQKLKATQETQKYYNSASKKDADYEHAGVAIAVHRKWAKAIEEVRELSGRNITVIIDTASGKTAFTSTYAPTAEARENQKNLYWEELSKEMEHNKGCIRILAGDFNARIYESHKDDLRYIGNNIIARKGYLAKGIAPNTLDNRDRFVDFAKTYELAVINTIIEKPAHKKVTYKEKVPQHNPDRPEYQGEDTGPYDHTKYAQCDYWLIDKTHQCMFRDCESKLEWARDSDHYPLWAKIQLNKKREEAKTENRKKGTTRYWKPEQEQWCEYNRRVWEILQEKHQKTWDSIRRTNGETEPVSPFTLALTEEEERKRELMEKYGHFCPRTPIASELNHLTSAQMQNEALADKWETKRSGIHRSNNMPQTPTYMEESQPRTPDTDIYDTMTHEDSLTPTLEQLEEAIKQAAEETLTKVPREKRQDYITKRTWEKIQALEEQKANTLEAALGTAAKTTNLELKLGPRRIWLNEPIQDSDTAHEYVDQAGGYWECKYCARIAYPIEAHQTACREGTCTTGTEQQRQKGREHKKMQAEIRKAVKQDRRTHVVEKFRENPEDKHKKHLWKAIKEMKSKFTPRYIQMKNRKGTLVPLKQRAEAIADYLENSHWSNPTADGAKRNISRTKIRAGVTQEHATQSKQRQTADFTMDELNEVIKLGKKGKAPGPDGITMELLKWLDHQNRALLLKTINEWWTNEEAPHELYYAKVATIYKKGETNRAENYRPISLLSGFYKIYMMLIRKRIQEEVEDIVSKAQYGFRPAKSTAHAIYIIRRIQDYAEKTGGPLHMTLLDWEKAFDKVDHDTLGYALERMGIDQKIINALRDGYDKASFYVEDDFGKSENKKQKSGIRQGCPLSPYLFVMVMTCIEADVLAQLTEEAKQDRLDKIDFDMVFYADDTIVFSRTQKGIEEILGLIQHTSSKYGLRLNKDKCVNMNMNTEGSQKLGTQADDHVMKSVEAAMYLGNKLNKRASVQEEIRHQMQQVSITWRRLHVYWRATNASKKWQLLAYDAIVKSKLLYGLETAQVGQGDLKKIDAFQVRGIRQILGKKHTYWDRSATNQALFDMASRILSERSVYTDKTTKDKQASEKNSKTEDSRGGWGSHIMEDLKANIESTEDERIRGEKALYNEFTGFAFGPALTGASGTESKPTKRGNYDALVADGTLKGRTEEANTTNCTRDKAPQATQQKNATEQETLIHDIEALRMLWVKDDSCWNTAEVFGEHRKRLRPFSEDYKYRKMRLMGHIIRADGTDPMRKVTFQENTTEEWAFDKRRIGRPRDQWTEAVKEDIWKKFRHMEDRQGHRRPNKRTKYKQKPLQNAYIHTWAGERHF